MDPLSYFSFQPVFHDWCNKGRCMCYLVCEMVHIKCVECIIKENISFLSSSLLRLCGVRHTVKDYSGSKRGNPLYGKEGNVLFNDTLNTFYLLLYGVIHMVKDHSDTEKGNPLPSHGLLFPICLIRNPYTSRQGCITFNLSSPNKKILSSQLSTTGVTNTLVCTILSVGWCI